MSTDTGESGCFHCSDPLPAKTPHAYGSVINSNLRYFCCPACKAVAETIHDLGLSAYYKQRDQKPQQAATTQREWAEMDLPEVQSTFVQQNDDGSFEAELLVADIHCASCCWLIEHRLQILPGIETVVAQLGQQKVRVRWRSESIRLSHIFSALVDIGYRSAPWHNSVHDEYNKRQQNQLLKRVGVAGIIAMQIHMIAMGNYFGEGRDLDAHSQQLMNSFALLLSLPIWLYSARPFFSSAWRHLRSGFLGMDLPIAIAILAAALVSIYSLIINTNDVYFDSIAMLVFFLTGARYLEMRARNRLSIHSQAPVLPLTCSRINVGGATHIAVQNLDINDVIRIESGEIIAADGTVCAGEATVEQAQLTGEYRPVVKKLGDTVLAGTVVCSGYLHVQVRKWGQHSQIAQLQQRVEKALNTKISTMPYERLTRYFTPTVLLIALASAIFWLYTDPDKALLAVLAVLVASCPCALSLAIPASQAAAILTLRRHGILITSQNALLLLPLIRCFVFDKTGTLTNGHFAILQTETFVDGVSAEQCLAIATALEAHATHPIATAFAKPTNNNIDHFTVSDVHEYLHQGIEGIINSTCYRLGSAKWCGFEPATIGKTGKTQVILTSETTTLARFTLGDSLRKEAQQCIQTLQKKGIHCAILSGDTSKHVEHIAHTLGIPDFVNACSPDDKVAHLHNLQKQHGPVAMFGDGINDGPVLTQANLSLTLADASQTARLAADVLLLNNRLTDLILLLETAHKSRWIARQNVAWAFFYNVSILPIAAAGLLSPAAAALGMAVSSLVVTLNALRLFITPPRHTLQHPES